MSLRALLIDDDPKLFELLSSYLSAFDVTLHHASDGGRGLVALERDVFDVVLLDVMMPVMGGLEVLKRIRAKGMTPVIMLTARGDETDRVTGLELGADDYLSKPFSPRELLARMRAVLRRSSSTIVDDEISVGPIRLSLSGRAVTVNGVAVDLTALEFDVLFALARRKGRVLSRDALLEEAGRTDVNVQPRTVDVHVSHLRQKLEDKGAPKLLKTVRGVGYVLAESETP